MKKLYTPFILAFIFAFASAPRAHAQVELNNDLTAETLVTQFFNSGVLVSLSNITFNGVPASAAPNEQLALFTNGLSDSLGMDAGLAMVAHKAEWLINENVVLPSQDNMYNGDPDIQAIGGGNAYMCAVIEFDVLVEADILAFGYFFASSEYEFFTCSVFNDAFGFFVSGPGIQGPYSNGAINIATIPDTDTPIAINTVNSGVSSVGSPAHCFNANPNWQNDSQYFVQNIGNAASSIKMNGYTVPLEATVDVINGETYHMKLAICNIGDFVLPSAVFFEEGSFEGRLASRTTAAAARELKVYPNPATDMLYFDNLCPGCTENVSISLMNVQGREVARFSVAPNGQVEVPVNALENGLYLLSAWNGNDLIARTKIVKR